IRRSQATAGVRKVKLCWALVVNHTHGSEHGLGGDRSGIRTDRDDVPEGGARDLGLRTLLPHDRSVHSPGARRAVEGSYAREAGRLGANLRWLPSHGGLARMHILRAADAEVPGRKGDTHGSRPPEMV